MLFYMSSVLCKIGSEHFVTVGVLRVLSCCARTNASGRLREIDRSSMDLVSAFLGIRCTLCDEKIAVVVKDSSK